MAATHNAQAQNAITEQDAQSIALDAYIYFYPVKEEDTKEGSGPRQWE
jgi:hypothetical protein